MDEFTQRESSSRPVSRRGARTSADSSRILAPIRPGTGMSAVRGMSAARPASSVRLGTASRLASAMMTSGPPQGTATSQRIGTALGYAGNLMTERPLTQHGLSGLPTSHGRIGTASGMRMVKDKRYWQAVLQAKINEIMQETSKLLKEKENMDREKSAKKMYDRKVKDAAKELTDLQSQLTDMNIALDSFGSGLTRQHLQREATALREKNESAQNQLETLFGERQAMEERNKALERDIEVEKNKIDDMILSLPSDEQERYRELQSQADDLKSQSFNMQSEIDNLSKQKDRLHGVILSSQMRAEAYRLHQKLREVTIKRDALRDEEENKLTPEQEREKLISEVRSNNQALTSISRQMKIVEEQLNEKKEQLQLIEQDLEEGNSERHAKYKELKRRDETMTNFLEIFPQQMHTERRNVEILKNQIAYAIEQITLQGINLKSYGITSLDLLDEKNDLNSQGGLLKEYKRLAIQLKQLQILEKRTSSQLKQLMEEEADILNQIRKYSSLDVLRAEAGENMEELTTKLEELKKKQKVTEDVVEESRRRNEEIKEHLRSNETYRQISHLEEKLVDLLRENKTLQEVVEQNRNENDYSEMRTDVENIVDALGKMLGDENQMLLKNLSN